MSAPADVGRPPDASPRCPPAGTLAAAYARCGEITGQQARNFAYGIRLLPPPKRDAMSALYAFARLVDDVGDGVLPVEEKLAALAVLRSRLSAAATGEPGGDPVLVGLADAMARYPIPVGALHELVSGCEMDCRQRRYETFEELVVYCRCVAGSIGRCSLGIFGSAEPERAPALADTLGIALQLTNILRDLVEDRDVMGRVYLPAEDLRRFGCGEDLRGSEAARGELVRFEAARAEAAYAEGLELLGLLDRRSRACVAAMAGIYLRLLRTIEANPLAPYGRRVALPVWEKAWVAARSLAGAGA